MLDVVIGSNLPTDEARVRKFETEHKLDLPLCYKEFLLRTNGGEPKPNAFPIEGLPNNPFGSLQTFFGLDASDPSSDIECVLRDVDSLIPTGIVPIGCTGLDDYLCLDLRKSAHPVVFWDRKPFWGTDVWREEDLYFIASNFEEFVKAIHHREF